MTLDCVTCVVWLAGRPAGLLDGWESVIRVWTIEHTSDRLTVWNQKNKDSFEFQTLQSKQLTGWPNTTSGSILLTDKMELSVNGLAEHAKVRANS